jgi:hypothetical protein
MLLFSTYKKKSPPQGAVVFHSQESWLVVKVVSDQKLGCHDLAPSCRFRSGRLRSDPLALRVEIAGGDLFSWIAGLNFPTNSNKTYCGFDIQFSRACFAAYTSHRLTETLVSS